MLSRPQQEIEADLQSPHFEKLLTEVSSIDFGQSNSPEKEGSQACEAD